MAASPPTSPIGRSRAGTNASIHSVASGLGSIRNAAGWLLNENPPTGMWAASASAASQAPTLADIRRGSFGHSGWTEHGQLERRGSSFTVDQDGRRRPSAGRMRTGSSQSGLSLGRGKRMNSAGLPGSPIEGMSEPFPSVTEEEMNQGNGKYSQAEGSGHDTIVKRAPIANGEEEKAHKPSLSVTAVNEDSGEIDRGAEYPNGYIEPPKLPVITPLGFCIFIYGLNVVAWGGMLFLLLCGAAPKMCSQNLPSNNFDGCNDIDSPRRIWLEIDSQILNALFCVTGFGLIPWRFRDLYWNLKWRFAKKDSPNKNVGLRRLAGIHRGWFRLPGSDMLDEDEVGPDTPALEDDPRLPIPISKAPDPPLTGVRAPPTPLWKMDFVIWCQVWNTFLQACLCGFMWGMNRYKRPSWSTGLFVALACIVAGVGGIVMFVEGKKVKKVEGVPVKPEVRAAVMKAEGQTAEKDLERGGIELKEKKRNRDGIFGQHAEGKAAASGSSGSSHCSQYAMAEALLQDQWQGTIRRHLGGKAVWLEIAGEDELGDQGLLYRNSVLVPQIGRLYDEYGAEAR
ncbi:hypothetical protein B0A49_06864 [Cryomyces minteri]|uniref:Uncharacterized protein n=1 Tax=Cryomyces minteri TaxID=331657 RepID=A0A4U0WR34_9PEZI|nr:hypothetical protein B0A49_06864 [Cryomyces minteri]